MLRIGSRIEVLRDDGIPARVIFDKVPENLRASPTLSVLASAQKPVNSDIRLSYLSRGLSWASDFVAVFDEAAAETSLQGWVTLTNNSGTGFENARVQLVAGDINIVSNEDQWRQRFNNSPPAATARGVARGTGEHQPGAPGRLLRLSDRTGHHAGQQPDQAGELPQCRTRQGEQGIRADPSTASSTTRGTRLGRGARALLQCQGRGLGEQLPGGVVRVYARDTQGQPQFVGEDHIGHTSAGSELALKIGDAFDVTMQPTLQSTRRVNSRRSEYTMKYLVRNARGTPITVTVRQLELWRFNEVMQESIKGRRTDADSFAWDVPVAANAETELTVTVAQWW